MPFVTIDPPDAKDHDDAVHAVPDPDPRNRGGYLVDVAIADVAHYVRPGSALDREAVRRGNSVYFPDRVVPMLPERISNDLCSLRPHEDRAALAVRMVIGADGRKRSHTFHRVLIRSAARLHYEQAQLRGDGPTDEVTEPIAQKDPRAALRRLSHGGARPRRARTARSRHPGTQDRAQIRRHRRSRDHAAAAGSAPADRGVHDPRQCRRRRKLRARQRAADLSRARRAVAGKAQRAARVFGDARYFLAERRHAAAGRLQSHPGAGQRPRRRTAGQRSRAAYAGAGRIFGGELRPFRPQSAPLCAFHLADPPLCRPRRASRADPRRQARRRRPAGRHATRARLPKSPPIFPPPNAAP